MPISCLHGERRHVRGKEYLAAMSYRRGMRDNIASPTLPKAFMPEEEKISLLSYTHRQRLSGD